MPIKSVSGGKKRQSIGEKSKHALNFLISFKASFLDRRLTKRDTKSTQSGGWPNETRNIYWNVTGPHEIAN